MTVRPTWPGHLMDLDEWSALPEDSERRYELAEESSRWPPARSSDTNSS